MKSNQIDKSGEGASRMYYGKVEFKKPDRRGGARTKTIYHKIVDDYSFISPYGVVRPARPGEEC